MKKLFGVVIVVVALSGCNKQKELALQNEVDSLRVELSVNRQMTETLQEVGLMMDSIDVNRHALRTDLVEGTSYANYADRMREINTYVAASQAKIDNLEDALKQSKTSQTKYASIVQQLKKDLETRALELTALTQAVSRYKAQNDTLMTTVNLQTAEINDKTEKIAAKQQEVQDLQTRVKEITEKANSDLANSYYERALALEETAKRTKFAPKKKKETQREALELYKMAASGGKTEANARIAVLEKEI